MHNNKSDAQPLPRAPSLSLTLSIQLKAESEWEAAAK